MGCGVSNDSNKIGEVPDAQEPIKEGRDLKLSSCRLVFSHQQLLRLNHKFLRLLECGNTDATREKQVVSLAVVVERLVQRLVCNAGSLDPRFSSKFLINLEPIQNKFDSPRNSLRFKYLVRLDAISTPALYPEYHQPPVRIIEGTGNESLPRGYAKIRVHGEYLEQWSEFINHNGYLRRDKIQERFVELLAKAAARPSEPFSPAQVDETRLCGSPGKIVDPITLHHVLRMSPCQQMFYGPAECNESRFPDPRDFRIAIVEGIPETRLHISFLSPTAQSLTAEEDIEISLTLGIGVAGWPQGTDFPSRLSLDHVDVLLGYTAAQTGYYLVPRGPHHTIRCDDRCSAWEIRTIAAEMSFQQHYSSASVVGRIQKMLSLLLETLRARGVKTINRYILKNLLFYELESKKGIQQWTPKSIARRLLSILDRLLSCLRNQALGSYMFKSNNLLLQEDALEEDYVSDGDILEHYMRQLYHDGGKLESHDGENMVVKDQLETVMLQKWGNVISNLSPPVSNRSRRLSVANSPASISYTGRQMEYVALLFREILKLKHVQQKNGGKDFSVKKHPDEVQDKKNNREDLIYLLQIVFDQAKQRLCTELSCQSHGKNSENGKKVLKLNQLIDSYDVSTAMLIDDLKRDKVMDYHFSDDMQLVAKVIEFAYKAIDSDGRVLGPVLRPYLNQLFKGSHENCWFLPEWKKKNDASEFEAIGAFSSLVVSGDIDPLDGILDSVNKGWNWAKNCLHVLQSITDENSAGIIIGEKIDSNESGLRLVFAPTPQKTIRHVVHFRKDEPGDAMKNVNLEESNWVTPYSTLKSNGPCKNSSDSKYATIRSFPDTLYAAVNSVEKEKENDVWSLTNNRDANTLKKLRSWCEKQPPHAKLRDANPLTVASLATRRQGTHRGLGSIVQALISLQKLTVLQEISQYLPEEERTRVLNDIKKLSKEVQRLAVNNYRRRSLPLFNAGKNRFSFKKTPRSAEKDARQKRRAATLPGKVVTNKKPASPAKKEVPEEIYRCKNEFSTLTQDTELKKEIEDRERKLDEELKKTKEDSLLGTCRLLRRQYRQTIHEPNTPYTPARTGRYGNVAATLPTAAINTPFYIKVSSFNVANREMTEI